MTKNEIEEMVVIGSRITVKAENRREFLELTTALLAPTQAEAGCLTYLFYEDPNRANHFFFFEEWRNRAAFDRHHAAPLIKNYEARIPKWLAETVVVNLYEVRNLTVMTAEPV